MPIKLIRYGILLSTLSLAACAQVSTVADVAPNVLTAGQVTLILKKNHTTQTEVVEKFGAPNLVTFNADGDESWTYQKHATLSTASSSSAFATIILAGVSTTTSGFEQSSRTITLIIKFKEMNGIKLVSDFSSRASSF